MITNPDPAKLYIQTLLGNVVEYEGSFLDLPTKYSRPSDMFDVDTVIVTYEGTDLRVEVTGLEFVLLILSSLK